MAQEPIGTEESEDGTRVQGLMGNQALAFLPTVQHDKRFGKHVGPQQNGLRSGRKVETARYGE